LHVEALLEQYVFALDSDPKFDPKHVARADPLKFAQVAPLAVIADVNRANPTLEGNPVSRSMSRVSP
jgi:hypothetical protein